MGTRLREQIESYDTVSFDIFDTLIMRRTLYPHDIFRIVEQKAKRERIPVPSFCENRIRSEQNLIAEIPNIYELYQELQRITEISDRDCRRLLELELETEHSQLVRRDSVCRLMDTAYEMGKQIFLISDMYLPKAVLVDWLKELGITKFQNAYISCEYHRPKVDGLYEIFQREIGETRHLHIGDSEIYDGRYARAAGMDALIIENAAHSMKMYSPVEIEPYMGQIENRAMLGLLAAGLYNDPFTERQMKPIEVRQLREMVEYAVAPMVSGLALWLIGKLTGGNYDGLLLAARDGYLIQKMLEIYEDVRKEKLPGYHYFYTSRAACAVSVIESKADFMQAVRRPSPVSLQECVKQRLEMVSDGKEDAEAFYFKNERGLIAKSAEFKRRYMRYAFDMGLSPEGNYLFFDFVSSGTCFFTLNRISGGNLTGAFCYRYGRHEEDDEKKALKIESFLEEGQGKRFWKYYKIFETILTSPDGMFLHFDTFGKPVFAEDLRSEQEKCLAEEMQEQVLAYWKHLLEFGEDAVPSRDLLVELTGLLDEKCTFCSDSRKDILYLYDSFESGKIKAFS